MQIKSKTRLAAIGVAITGAMLVAHLGFTVAWYNGSSNLQVYNFDVSLKNKELKISVDGDTWKDSLSYDDVKDAIPSKYKPVSSAFSDNWISNHESAPKFTSGYTKPFSENMTSLNDIRIMDEGYFQKTLYLKCSSSGIATLDASDTYMNADEDANASIAPKLKQKVDEFNDMSVSEVTEWLNKIENSLRFSVLVINEGEQVKAEDYTIVDPHKTGTTELGGILDTDLDGYYDSFDGKEVLYGDVVNASQAQWSTIAPSEDVGNKGTNSCFDAAHKKEIFPLDLEASNANGMRIKQEESLSLENLEDLEIELEPEVSKKIVLSLYIEGWDKDSVNYTMFSRFLTKLSFKLKSGANGGN